MPNSKKVHTNKCHTGRQPEIATWPPKNVRVIQLKLQQTASKFQRQIRDFQPWRARIKCRQVIAAMTDNRKWQCGPPNRKYLYLWNFDSQDDNSNGNLEGFRPRPARRNWPRAIATTTDNRKTFWAPIFQFLVVDRCRNHLANLFSS